MAQAKPVFDEKGESGALPPKRAQRAKQRGGNGAAVNFARALPRAKAKLGTAREQTKNKASRTSRSDFVCPSKRVDCIDTLKKAKHTLRLFHTCRRVQTQRNEKAEPVPFYLFRICEKNTCKSENHVL